MKRLILLLAITTLLFSALSGCGSDKKESGLEPVSLAAAAYVGSDRCARCHNDIYLSFTKSGHPYKYQHTGGATPGAYVIPGLFTPLKGADMDTATLGDACDSGLVVCNGTGDLDWTAINYTVGGFGWKIRWGMRDFGQNAATNPAGNQTGYLWTAYKTGSVEIQGDGIGDDDGVCEAGETCKTNTTSAQYNIRNGSWSDYNGGKDKKYECAICHNTDGIVSTAGYDCETNGGTDASPARPQPWAKNPGMGPETHGGYYSSWSLDGIQCEECHGPGSVHIESPYRTGSIVRNKTISGNVEYCAKCHIRAENTTKTGAVSNAECGGNSNSKFLTNGAKASGDFIQHHEQYNELVGYNGDGVHATLSCTTCHDPHKRATTVVETVRAILGITDNHLSGEVRGAIKVSCQSCHPGKDQVKSTPANMKNGHLSVTCVDCHMAEATKTATNSSTAGWGRKADLKTHIFRIDPAGTTITRTNAETPAVTIAQNYITPRYACGKCHDVNIGTATPIADEATAQGYATGYHTP